MLQQQTPRPETERRARETERRARELKISNPSRIPTDSNQTKRNPSSGMEDLRISASGSRGGGGATLSRRAPNGSAGRSNYDDVFGGPPRYSGPFAARPADYSEIFGGLSSSCSIPVLDLPPALDAQSSGLDYFEIFGGFGGENFALSYEELVAEQERVEPRRTEIPSSNERVPKETEFGQQVTEVSEFSPDCANREHLAYLGKDKISFDANYLDDGSKQLNMSYHMTGRGNIEDTITETVHLTQLHVVPGFTFDVDSISPLQNTSSGHPPNMLTNDLGLNAALNDRVCYQKEGKTFSLSSSSASPESSENDLKTDHKQFATKCPTEDGPVNLKHHSRSLSNHSTSSGDMYYPDFTFLTVSDVSLRTQPLHVPPPARPPPKLANNQETPKMKIYAHSKYDADESSVSKPIENHQKNSGWGPPKRHAPQVSVRESSYFFDVEVDASSAAAASAAAMKEAMEQAQARLKSAKESMERKREYFQSRKKLGQQEGTKFKEGKDNKTAQEVEIFSEVLTQKSFLEEGKKKNESALEERQKARGTAKITPDREEKERHILSDEQNQQKVRGNGFKSQESYKSNESSGEWKTDKQFYELVNNEKNFKVVKKLSDQECAEKIQKVPIKVNKEKGIMSKEANLSYAFGRKGNLREVDEIQEREENAKKKSDAGKTIYREEKIKELPNAVTEVCGKEENVLEEISDSHEQVKNENKLGETQKACDSEEDLKMSDTGEVVPACGKIEVKLKHSVEACKFELVHESEEKESKLKAAKEVFEHDDSEDLSGSYMSCQSHDSEKKFKIASKTGMQGESDTEIRESDASYMSEAGDNMEAAPELNQCKNSEKSREETKIECYEEENENKLEATSLASEQKENKKFNKTEEAPMLVENQMKPKVAQAANEIQLDLEQLKSAQGVVQSRENEKIETVKACSHDHNENKNEEEQKTVHVPCELENSEVLTVAVRMHEKKETKHIKEVHLDENVKEKFKIFNAARDFFQTAVNKDLEDGLETRVFEKKGDMLTSAQNITETCSSVVTEKTTTEIRRIEERLNERRMERDGEQEKERKLEEEKERAREREKDRIAVERATREAHERTFAEAREKAERIAVERVTAEARQRALAEAIEKAEKASAEALEKTLAEKASREARLRVERAAVERATAEARERAVERALAEKAAADARERTEKLNAAASKDRTRRDNEAEEHFRSSDKGDNGARDFPHDVQFQSAGSSSNAQRHLESYNHGEGESALRCKARLERHQRTVERAAKALAEKNMRDMLAQREQAERNRLSETLDADVKRWSTGKEGNLRALLSTLQYILGLDSGWQPIPLTDVITAAAVKKAYRKATLCVHPDKLQQRGASIQQKYICEKVFDLLKDAWNRFNSEER